MDKKVNPKAGVEYTGSYQSESSHLAWTSSYMDPNSKEKKAARAGKDDRAHEHQKVFGALGNSIEQAKGADLDIWQSINPGTWYGTNPQQAIQTMQGLKAGDEIMAFDFETVGTFFGDTKKGQMDFGSITEMAFGRYRLNDKMLPEHMGKTIMNEHGRSTFAPSEYGKNALSVLVKPNEHSQAKIKDLVNRASAMGRRWTGFSADEYRTLNDLILYSDSKNIEKMHGMTFIMGQNRQAQALEGSIFTQDHIKAMKRGFDNLKRQGTNAEQLAVGLDKFFYQNGSGLKKMAGFNTQNFDVPIFKEFLATHILPQLSGSQTATKAVSRMMKDLQNVQNVDLYQAISVVNKNLHDTIGPSGKQHNIAKKLGIQFADAHFGLDDLQLTMDIWGKMGDSFASTIHQSQGVTGHRKATWNPTPLKPGMELFSVAGMGSNQMSPLDMVFKKGKNGFTPAYEGDFSPNPIYKNTRYTVEKMVKDIEHGGKKYSGVMLHNQDDDLYHFVANEDEHKLRNTFQQSFRPLDQISMADRMSGKDFSGMDRARRRWDKMFDQGGVDMMERMLTGLDALQEGRKRWAPGTKGSDKQLAHFVQSAMSVNYGGKPEDITKGTKEMYRDLLAMEGRLVGESPYLRDFVASVRANKDINGSRYLQGVAATAFRGQMDQTFGENRSSVSRGGHLPLLSNLTVDGMQGLSMNLQSQSAIEGSIRNIVGKGQGGKVYPGVTRTRLKSLLGELKAKGVFSVGTGVFGEGINGSDRLKQYESMIEQIGNGTGSQENAYMVFRNLSADIEKAHQLQKIQGITNVVDVDDPTKLIRAAKDKKGNLLEEPKRGDRLSADWNKKGADIIQYSMQHARLFSTETWQNGKLNMKSGPLKNIVDDHQFYFNEMLEKTGVKKSGIHNTSKFQHSLANLASAYKTGDTEVAFISGQQSGRTTFHMVVANKNDAERIFKLAPNKIIEDSKAFAIAIPLLNSSRDLVMPGTSGASVKLAQLTALNLNGTTGIGTGTDVAIQKAINMSRYAKDMMATGNAVKASSVVSMQMKDAVNNLSARTIDKDLKGTESKARLWSLSGMVDIGGYAEDWYERTYASDPSKNIARIRDKMEANRGMSFIDAMSGKDQLAFQRGIDSFMQEEHGLRTHTHSAKDSYVAKHVRSTRDIRELTPLGYFNPMARENLMKSINYKSLDTSKVADGLRANGIGEDQINRYLSRGFVTDVAKENLESGSKTAYLNVRSANMHSNQIADIVAKSSELQKILKDSNIDPARLSTYEGNFIMRESLASAFEVRREGKVKFEEKHILDPKIKALFDGKEANSEGIIKLNSQVDLRQLMGGTNIERDPGKYHGHKDAQRITVGWLEGEKAKRDAVTLSTPSKNIMITGFNQKTNQLMFDTIDKASTATKFLTDVGDRVTAGIYLPDRAMDIIAKGADVIMEENKIDRGQFGSEFYKSIGLVVDEARRKQVTVGQIGGKDVMTVLEGLMQSHLSMGEAIKIEGDQAVLSSVFGLESKTSYKQLGQFLAASSETLGIDPELLGISYKKNGSGYDVSDSKKGIAYGQIGLGVGDVYNWEKSIGAVDSYGDGLVNWGIKEVDVLLTKANHSLKGPHEGKQAIVKEWLTNHMDQAIEAQNGGIHTGGVKGYKIGLSSAARHMKTTEIPAGMPIIRTGGNNFEGSRVVDGRVEMSMNALEDTPQFKVKQSKTVQDYQRTLIQSGQVDVQFGEALKKNNGVFMLEMPEGSSKSHVTMLDTTLTSIPGTDKAMLNDIQQSQASVWTNLKALQNIQLNGDSAKNQRALESAERGLERSISNHESVITKATVSSGEGGLAKIGMTAKMDMAAQFRIQGVNPLSNTKYKEGTAYVSADRLFEMVSGRESNIMEEVMGYQASEVEKMTIQERRSSIVDYTQTKGLYGFTNRYPTIDRDTIQALRVEVDPSLKGQDRGAYLTVGTATRLKADYDGDFLSIVMSQYKEKSFAKDMHGAMAVMNEVDTERFVDTGNMMMQGLSNEANKRGVTVGSLMQDTKYMESLGEHLVPRVRTIDDMETLQSRMGKQYVGSFDNTRHKLIQLASDTYSIIEGNQHRLGDMFGSTAAQVKENLVGRKDKVAEFGRILSQDTISAKKWSISATQEQLMREADESTQAFYKANPDNFQQATMEKMSQRVEALELMQRGVKKMDASGKNDILKANEILGLFKSDEAFDAQVEAARNHPLHPAKAEEGIIGQRYKLSEMLDTVTELYQANGKDTWLDNASVKSGVSGGPSEDVASRLLNLEVDGGVVMTDWMKNMQESGVFGDQEMSDRLNALQQRRANNVVARLNGGGELGSKILDRPQQVSDALLSGETAAQRMGTGFSDLSSQFMGNMGTGKVGAAVGWGAAVFGGLWATSALMRSGPKPEGTDAQELTAMRSIPTRAGLGGPTARITPQSENINIQINAKDAQNMGTDQVTALVQQELNAMMNLDMNMQVNVQDNTQNISKQWLQETVAKAINGDSFAF